MPSMPSATYQPRTATQHLEDPEMGSLSRASTLVNTAATARQHLGDVEMGTLSRVNTLTNSATRDSVAAGESTLKKSRRRE